MSREFPKNPEPKIARPTVGRIVHVFVYPQESPFAAIVAQVLDELTINAMVINPDGSSGPLKNIAHASVPRNGNMAHWDWMDYQKGQAAKTEQLESELGKLQAGAPSPEDGKR